MKPSEINPRFNELHFEVKQRMLIEMRVVKRVIEAVLATGNWKLYGIDLDDDIEKTPTLEEAMKLIFNLDDAVLTFACTAEKRSRAWVRFVMGNDGWDVVCDYSLSPHGFEQAVEAASGNDDDLDKEEV